MSEPIGFKTPEVIDWNVVDFSCFVWTLFNTNICDWAMPVFFFTLICYIKFYCEYYVDHILFLSSLCDSLLSLESAIHWPIFIAPLAVYIIACSPPHDPASVWTSRRMKFFAKLFYSDTPIYLTLALILMLLLAHLFVWTLDNLFALADLASPWGLTTHLWVKRRQYIPSMIYDPLAGVSEMLRLEYGFMGTRFIHLLKPVGRAVRAAWNWAALKVFRVLGLAPPRFWPDEAMTRAYGTKDPDSFRRAWSERSLGLDETGGIYRRFGPFYGTGSRRLPFGHTRW